MAVPGRWSLGIPTGLQGREVEDPWIFKKGQPVPDLGRLMLPVNLPGRALDFSWGGIGTPVVHVKVAALLSELAPEDVQNIPVEIQGYPDQFCILVATRLIQCIDDQASGEVQRWTPEDGRPEKTGQYRDVDDMRIDPSRVGGAKVFRTWGWSIALIVHEEIQSALTRMGATGMKFEAV
jgi:hypothetical protein